MLYSHPIKTLVAKKMLCIIVLNNGDNIDQKYSLFFFLMRQTFLKKLNSYTYPHTFNMRKHLHKKNVNIKFAFFSFVVPK